MLDLARLLRVPQVHLQFEISPDGTRLAYALDMDGSESYHLVIFDFATGQHKD
jgi:protease II